METLLKLDEKFDTTNAYIFNIKLEPLAVSLILTYNLETREKTATLDRFRIIKLAYNNS